MKKISFVILGIICLCLPFVLVGCGQAEQKLNSYKIDATFDDQQNILACSQTVEYVNTSDNALSEVCFFLYANSFNEGKKAVSNSYFDRAYPSGEASFGGIDILSADVNGNETEFYLSEGGNILTITLDKEIFPNECVTIDLEYVVSLANIRHRLGVGNNTINFGNFFPIACVYDNGFVKNDFSMSGDPFYSDVSNFEVKIAYPDKYIFTSTGESNLQKQNEQCVAICKAQKVRDFCFVLSDKFEVLTQEVCGIQVNYFYYDDSQPQARLETSLKAVETFCEMFGQYPYKVLNVVKSDFCFGGMEYPNLVLIADDLADSETEDYVIVHEIAHQWWYGVVGNNEFENAWVDEGLTEFSTALFFEKNEQYGLNYETIMQNAAESYNNFVKIYKDIYGELDESMNRKLSQFRTEPEYVNCTYTKGMLMFDSIRKSMSDRKFFQCLKQYFEDYAFKNSSAEKLVESFSKTAHINLEKFVDAWLEGRVVLAN